jgi:hypothetical protein
MIKSLVKEANEAPKPLYPLFALISLGLSLLTFIGMGVLTIGVWQLATRPLPQLVQLEDGESMSVRPASSDYREPELIKDYVGQMFQLFFTWSNIMQVEENGEKTQKTDIGQVIEGNLVPTPAFEAGFSLDESFRSSFLKNLADLIPEGVWTGRTQAFLKIDYLSEPEEIKAGHWKLNLVANLLIQSGNRTQRVIPINKTVYIQAIDTPAYLVPVEIEVAQIAHRIRSAGLQIYQIEDFNKNEQSSTFR